MFCKAKYHQQNLKAVPLHHKVEIQHKAVLHSLTQTTKSLPLHHKADILYSRLVDIQIRVKTEPNSDQYFIKVHQTQRCCAPTVSWNVQQVHRITDPIRTQWQ